MIEELMRDVLAAEKDSRKFDNGNTEAGKRARKQMQVVRRSAKKIRDEIQKTRKTRKAEKNAQLAKIN
jgi:hypothetical protein